MITHSFKFNYIVMLVRYLARGVITQRRHCVMNDVTLASQKGFCIIEICCVIARCNSKSESVSYLVTSSTHTTNFYFPSVCGLLFYF